MRVNIADHSLLLHALAYSEMHAFLVKDGGLNSGEYLATTLHHLINVSFSPPPPSPQDSWWPSVQQLH